MRLQDILPYSEFTIKTLLSIDKINTLLKENTDPKDNKFFSRFNYKDKKLFRGVIFRDSFKISRNISNQNSFLTTISGYIKSKENFSIIKLKIETNRTLLVIWYLMVIIMGFLMNAFDNIFNSSFKNYTANEGNGILIFIFLLTPILAFKYESYKSKKILAKLLKNIKD